MHRQGGRLKLVSSRSATATQVDSECRVYACAGHLRWTADMTAVQYSIRSEPQMQPCTRPWEGTGSMWPWRRGRCRRCAAAPALPMSASWVVESADGAHVPVLLQRMPFLAHCPADTAARAGHSAQGAALAGSTLTSRTSATALRLLHSMSAWPCEANPRAVGRHLVSVHHTHALSTQPWQLREMLSLKGFSAKAPPHMLARRGLARRQLGWPPRSDFQPSNSWPPACAVAPRPVRAHPASPSHAGPPGAMTGSGSFALWLRHRRTLRKARALKGGGPLALNMRRSCSAAPAST